MALFARRYLYRSSVSGRWVSRWYALRHPRTTERHPLP